MKYINKNFSIEKVKARNLAKKFDTPIYCYSYKQLKENINNFIKTQTYDFTNLLITIPKKYIMNTH